MLLELELLSDDEYGCSYCILVLTKSNFISITFVIVVQLLPHILEDDFVVRND